MPSVATIVGAIECGNRPRWGQYITPQMTAMAPTVVATAMARAVSPTPTSMSKKPSIWPIEIPINIISTYMLTLATVSIWVRRNDQLKR